MEAKQTMEEIRKIQADLHFDAKLVVSCVGRASALAMLWKSHVSLHIQTYSLNHIDVHILNGPSSLWRLTGFYDKLEEH